MKGNVRRDGWEDEGTWKVGREAKEYVRRDGWKGEGTCKEGLVGRRRDM